MQQDDNGDDPTDPQLVHGGGEGGRGVEAKADGGKGLPEGDDKEAGESSGEAEG
jgi:hypothetical protein